MELENSVTKLGQMKRELDRLEEMEKMNDGDRLEELMNRLSEEQEMTKKLKNVLKGLKKIGINQDKEIRSLQNDTSAKAKMSQQTDKIKLLKDKKNKLEEKIERETEAIQRAEERTDELEIEKQELQSEVQQMMATKGWDPEQEAQEKEYEIDQLKQEQEVQLKQNEDLEKEFK